MSEVSKFGKSNGEMQINNYTITNSVLIKKAGGFTKITPRYVLNNIDKIISNCDINQDGKIDYQEFIQSTISQQSVINRVKI